MWYCIYLLEVSDYLKQFCFCYNYICWLISLSHYCLQSLVTTKKGLVSEWLLTSLRPFWLFSNCCTKNCVHTHKKERKKMSSLYTLLGIIISSFGWAECFQVGLSLRLSTHLKSLYPSTCTSIAALTSEGCKTWRRVEAWTAAPDTRATARWGCGTMSSFRNRWARWSTSACWALSAIHQKKHHLSTFNTCTHTATTHPTPLPKINESSVVLATPTSVTGMIETRKHWLVQLMPVYTFDSVTRHYSSVAPLCSIICRITLHWWYKWYYASCWCVITWYAI